MIGEIISAGSRLVGGLLDRDTANKNRDQEMRIAQQNMELQKQFAQEGIRWKVADAKEAGIHPLYALGASTTSFSPVSISGGHAGNMGETLGGMGQDISRAIHSTRTAPERVAAAQETALRLEGLKLDNDIKRASIASSVQRINQQASNPALPGLVPEAGKYEDRPALRGDLGPLATNPRIVNAEDIEKRHGDLAQNLWGVYTMAGDFLHHARQNTNVRRTGRRGDWWDFVPRVRWGRTHTFKERWKGE